MILERATADDLPSIVQLMNHAYRGGGPVASWNSETGHIAGDRTSVALLEAEIAAKPDAELLVVRDDAGAIYACVWLDPLGDGCCYLGSLAIDPARQNGGVGRRMLAACEDRARRRGGHTMRMTVVNVRETLIAWYLRRGYLLTGETAAFPYDDQRFGVPMRDDLHFVVLEKRLA